MIVDDICPRYLIEPHLSLPCVGFSSSSGPSVGRRGSDPSVLRAAGGFRFLRCHKSQVQRLPPAIQRWK